MTFQQMCCRVASVFAPSVCQSLVFYWRRFQCILASVRPFRRLTAVSTRTTLNLLPKSHSIQRHDIRLIYTLGFFAGAEYLVSYILAFVLST